jgi:hypothetical protein
VAATAAAPVLMALVVLMTEAADHTKPQAWVAWSVS